MSDLRVKLPLLMLQCQSLTSKPTPLRLRFRNAFISKSYIWILHEITIFMLGQSVQDFVQTLIQHSRVDGEIAPLD